MKARTICITPEVFRLLLIGGCQTIEHIPKDLRLLLIHHDSRFNLFECWVESQEFDDVSEGGLPPRWDLSFINHETVRGNVDESR